MQHYTTFAILYTPFQHATTAPAVLVYTAARTTALLPTTTRRGLQPDGRAVSPLPSSRHYDPLFSADAVTYWDTGDDRCDVCIADVLRVGAYTTLFKTRAADHERGLDYSAGGELTCAVNTCLRFIGGTARTYEDAKSSGGGEWRRRAYGVY